MAICERPIIMTGVSVRGILANIKRMTRRVIKQQPIGYRTCWSDDLEAGDTYIETDGSLWKVCESKGRNKRAAGELTPVEVNCPYGKVGDKLWVKEKHALGGNGVFYEDNSDGTVRIAWTSPRFMKKIYARLWLEITNIRVEKIKEISDKDVLAEGIEGDVYGEEIGISPTSEPRSARIYFMELWDSLNDKRGFSWSSNPFVWVIEFKVLEIGK